VKGSFSTSSNSLKVSVHLFARILFKTFQIPIQHFGYPIVLKFEILQRFTIFLRHCIEEVLKKIQKDRFKDTYKFESSVIELDSNYHIYSTRLHLFSRLHCF
jgi:hypothetical protein